MQLPEARVDPAPKQAAQPHYFLALNSNKIFKKKWSIYWIKPLQKTSIVCPSAVNLVGISGPHCHWRPTAWRRSMLLPGST